MKLTANNWIDSSLYEGGSDLIIPEHRYRLLNINVGLELLTPFLRSPVSD